MKTGKIIQVMGPVVDVEFEDENLPAIRDALEVLNGDKKSVMEVAQHIGNNTVRCIMLLTGGGLAWIWEVPAHGAAARPRLQDTWRRADSRQTVQRAR